MAIIALPGLTAFTDTNGKPLSGAKLRYYDAGTLTPKTIYTDAALSIAHPNPLTADAYGRFPNVYVGVGDYKIRVTTAGGSTVYETDNIPGESAPSGGSGSGGGSGFVT